MGDSTFCTCLWHSFHSVIIKTINQVSINNILYSYSRQRHKQYALLSVILRSRKSRSLCMSAITFQWNNFNKYYTISKLFIWMPVLIVLVLFWCRACARSRLLYCKLLRLVKLLLSFSKFPYSYQRKCGHTTIGVDLAGLLGGRMASAEGGSVSSGMAYGEGCPLSSRLRGLGERRELPQRAPKTDFGVFWRPQNAHFCTYMTKSGGTICISAPPRSKFWGGTCPPVHPVIYAHAYHVQCLVCLVKTATNQNGESQNGDKKRLYCARLVSTYFVHWLWNHWRVVNCIISVSDAGKKPYLL